MLANAAPPQHPRTHRASHTLIALALFILAMANPLDASAQGIDPAHRPVAEVRIEGLVDVPLQLVMNQVRLKPGDPYDPQTVQGDIVRITHLGRFSSVQAQLHPQPDGRLIVAYVVLEQSTLADVQVVGNKHLSDQELLALVVIRRGDPIDPHLIERGIKHIKRAYEQAGYFVTDVQIDKQLLQESGILIYRVREGPQVRIKRITFRGNEAFTDKQLASTLRSKTYMFIFRKGELSRDRLNDDVAKVREFYQDRGYLDAQVGRRIDLSPDQKDANVEFFVDEGKRYTVADVRIEGNTVFHEEQLRQTIALKPGEPYSALEQRKTRRALIDLYGKLGFIQTAVQIDRLYHEDRPAVDVLIRIREGNAYTVGTVTVRGNQLTQDKVILRQVRGMSPGEPFNRTGIDTTERRLRESRLFTDAKVTILDEPGPEVRDVLIEVKEGNSGSLSFGAGVSSDSGLLGAIDLVQRNFDIADVPDSFGETFTGRAFRGAGQYFALSLQPGNELSRYSVSFREPYMFESNYFLDTSFFFFEREREDWDEQRVGARLGVGKRFGDVWSGSVRFRVEEIEIADIEPDAPVDAFDVEGDNLVTSVGFEATRNTTDSRILPTRGNRLTFGIHQVGALGGDFDYTQGTAEFTQFWTVEEDFYGRPTIIRARVRMGYNFNHDEAPLFERFHAGGHRTFRGFEHRGVGPRGIRADNGRVGDDPVGGDWQFLFGLQYSVPVHKDVLRMVFFVDSGTVEDDFDFSDYRISVGSGVRLKVPFLGQAPFALDFAVPILDEDGDETQVFSFDLALPF